MKRPLVVLGPDPKTTRLVGRSVSQLTSTRLEDRWEGDSETLPMAWLEDPSPRVIVAPSTAWAARDQRLPALERAVVVQIGEGAGTCGEVHGRIDDRLTDVDDAAEQLRTWWQRDALAVAAGDRSYVVEVARGVLSDRITELVGAASLALLVTDGNVEPLHASKVTRPLEGKVRLLGHVMKPGEKSKIVRTIVQIWNVALEGQADRSSVFVGLGGGVVTDITGFAAATWMRGVRWVALPTTLLAMVDASVGGKTGVDLRAAKNAVGAFWQPSAVVCDVDTLLTEPRRGFVSALAEVVKTALIGDPELFELMEASPARLLDRDPELLMEIVRRCVTVKARVVAQDEREGGLRAVLNLGHTVGHALEANSGYALAHGEAVSLGLVAACRIGEKLGETPAELTERVVQLLRRLELPTELLRDDLAAASGLVGHDKKRAGSSVKFVVVKAVGEVTTVPVGLDDLRSLTRSLA